MWVNDNPDLASNLSDESPPLPTGELKLPDQEVVGACGHSISKAKCPVENELIHRLPQKLRGTEK